MPAGTFNTPEYRAERDAARRRLEQALDNQRNHNARMFILNTLAEDLTLAELERILALKRNILKDALEEL